MSKSFRFHSRTTAGERALHTCALLSCAAVLAAFAGGCGGAETGTGGSGGTGAGGSGGTGAGGSGTGGSESAPLTVDTDKGPVTGALHETTRAFLGIPFAAPPVGDLRWKPPAAHEAWTEAFDATKKGPACAQMNALSGAFDAKTVEDCLTLNVWTPEKPASGALPVLVWIHGGGFTLGSGGGNDYDGQVLSATTGAIVVTMNYRLGPMGFLAMSELKDEDANHPSTGGYGLEDQRAALEWVKANIAAFGGDPKKVTLFGESAGGISTCMHIVSPQSKGLFQRAIIESGPCDSLTAEADGLAQGVDFVAALGCTGAPDVLACVRGKTTEEVMTALPASSDFFIGEGASWFPVLDGWNLPDLPSKLLSEGKFEKVPVILGSNRDEGSIFLFLAGDAGKVPDEAAFEALVELLAPGHGAEVVAKYPTADYGTAQAAATAAIGDAAFVCPTRRAARALSANGADTFLYQFTYDPGSTLLGDLGCFHSAEVKFVFGGATQLLPGGLSDEELAMSQEIMGYWYRHTDAGSPNGGKAFEWPKYDVAKDENIVLDLTISKQSGLKKDQCDFWDGVGPLGQ